MLRLLVPLVAALVLFGCASQPPVTRIETRTVPKLEFISVPDAATAPCLVPLPPVDSNGVLPYERLPAYLTEVLGAVEKCNVQLHEIDTLSPDG